MGSFVDALGMCSTSFVGRLPILDLVVRRFIMARGHFPK